MERTMRLTLVASLAALCLAPLPARAGDVDAKAAFQRLKTLVGTWEGHGDQPTGFPVKIEFRLTGAGSALEERTFPGTDHEMLTIYYMDGNDLVLTHYCAGANQPHMKLVAGGAEGALKFDFVSGTNLDPEKTSHMHSAIYSSIAPDKYEATWSAFDAGKPSGAHTFFMAKAAGK
jgi:hypothetical protein